MKHHLSFSEVTPAGGTDHQLRTTHGQCNRHPKADPPSRMCGRSIVQATELRDAFGHLSKRPVYSSRAAAQAGISWAVLSNCPLRITKTGRGSAPELSKTSA